MPTMVKATKWYQKEYIQEVGLFITMFILTMLHEWIQVDTFMGFIKGFVFFLILYILAQIHRHFIFPLFQAKIFLAYTLVTIVSTIAGAIVLYVANYFWIQPDLYFDLNIVFAFIYHFVICIISTIIILSLFLIRKYSVELQKRNRDQLLISEMNIKFLQAQLNPHFFFNMLNNLYGVSLTEPQRVPDLIIRLSSLMRYQLENGNRDTVSIDEEIKYIESYIIMEKERIGKRCEIVFICTPDNNGFDNLQIAPLILITLIENAFKHSLTIERKWFVNIHIDVVDNILNVSIVNSMADKSLEYESIGIGLMNIRERLELLYKGYYTFTISHSDAEFKTNLSLQLKHY